LLVVCGAPDLSGRSAEYSDLAITLWLGLRIVYGLRLRQPQGLNFPSVRRQAVGTEPVHLVDDNTRLKAFDASERLKKV
jgi:hypothetical protein